LALDEIGCTLKRRACLIGPKSSASQKLKAGDRVRFQVATERATGKRRACNVALVERAADKPYRGFVCVLKDDFGFVEDADRRRMVFFHTSDVIEGRCAPRRDGWGWGVVSWDGMSLVLDSAASNALCI
jgi:cold shock CspA family protein